jgi:hypothetical protein
VAENHTDQAEGPGPIADALGQLHRAGWSVGDVASSDGAGGLAWLVSGSNGEYLIRAEGRTRAEAWGRTLDRAQSPGMLGT